MRSDSETYNRLTELVTIQPDLASEEPNLRQAAFDGLVKTIRAQDENWLKAKFPALVQHMVEEAVSDACLELWKVLEKPGWEKKWTRGFLRYVAYNECRKRRRQFYKATERFGDHMGKDHKNPDVEATAFGSEGPQVEEHELHDEHLKIIEGAVRTMPLQQRRVARLMLKNHDFAIGPKELIQLYLKAHRIKLTHAAAKSALAVVREKVREAKAIADRKRRSLAEEDQ